MIDVFALVCVGWLVGWCVVDVLHDGLEMAGTISV